MLYWMPSCTRATLSTSCGVGGSRFAAIEAITRERGKVVEDAMTLQEILNEIPQLSTREQLIVLHVLRKALHDSAGGEEPTAEHLSVVDQLYGAFNPTGAELSDEAIDRIRFEALMNKYQ
jgi:hypothetical protein